MIQMMKHKFSSHVLIKRLYLNMVTNDPVTLHDISCMKEVSMHENNYVTGYDRSISHETTRQHMCVHTSFVSRIRAH